MEVYLNYLQEDMLSAKKRKCQQLLIRLQQSVNNYNKIGRRCNEINKKIGHDNPQWERCDNALDHATQNSDDLRVKYRDYCKKELDDY